MVVSLLLVIFVCFAIQIVAAAPPIAALVKHLLIPSPEIVTNPAMLYIAIGIIGATVMPHNLYLHSGIVQTRAYGDSVAEKREALKFSIIDSTLALTFALTINASLLVLAAAVFFPRGEVVTDIGQASHLLTPLLGSSLAPILFGVALICCGLNSTVTATMAGQIVMEGFIHLRIAAWARRLITRGIAIVPALIAVYFFGAAQAGKLLVFSQVILSFQLPFAVVPLVLFTASREKLGELVSPRWLTIIATLVAALIIGLNVKLIYDFFSGSLG
jgi:manganese transport protein